jgi:hypothetical protein
VSDATTPPPTGVDLDADSFPVMVRAMPRLVRKVTIGVLLGTVLGVAVGLGLPGSGAMDRAMVIVLVASGFAVISGLIACANATGGPRWSLLPPPSSTDEAH